ncbi:hypothetical protein WDV91_16060 [Curtobacterium flaccumfaciens pv. flaccumfaciens]
MPGRTGSTARRWPPHAGRLADDAGERHEPRGAGGVEGGEVDVGAGDEECGELDESVVAVTAGDTPHRSGSLLVERSLGIGRCGVLHGPGAPLAEERPGRHGACEEEADVGAELVGGPHDERCAVVQHGASRVERPCDVDQGEVRLVVEGAEQVRECSAECGRRLRRHGDAGRSGVHCTLGQDRWLLEEDVRVGAAHPERAHAGPARSAARPGAQGVGDEHRGIDEVDLRVRGDEVQRRRDDLVSEHPEHLQHPGHPGGGVEVADVRLGRTDGARLPGVRPRRERLDEAVDLDGVPELRRGPVGLDVAHGARIDAGIPPRRSHDGRLSAGAGRRDAGRRTVLVRSEALDDAVDVVAVALRPGERLQQEGDGALPAAGALGVGREGPRPVRGRLDAEGTLLVRRRDERETDGTGDRRRHATGAEVLARRDEGRHGRRARRVDDHRGTGEVEHVTDAAGHDRSDATGRTEPSLRGVARFVTAEVEPRHESRCRVDAGLRAAQRDATVPGVLDRVDAGGEEQSLVGIHELCLGAGDPVPRRIETVDVVEVRVRDRVRQGGAQSTERELVSIGEPIRRERPDQVRTAVHRIPERPGGPGGTDPGRDPDDRDGSVCPGGRVGGHSGGTRS